jgi:hypothetical protein
MTRVSSTPSEAQHLRDLVLLRRVRDRMDHDFAQSDHAANHQTREMKIVTDNQHMLVRRIRRGEVEHRRDIQERYDASAI